MDGNEAAAVLSAQINALRAERDGTADQAKKAAAQDAITKLQAARTRVIVAEANAIGPEIDRLVAELEEIRTGVGLDAVSALGRTIERLRPAVS